ncbi:MAG TPA: hypothetical protein VGH80_08440 [Xanthomonadaceae bacterium]|jgi:hypothetical protein
MDPVRHALSIVSLYGDPVATVAAAAGCAMAFAARRRWAAMAGFMAMLLAVVAIEVATKVVYYGWGFRFGIASFRGVSGHVLRAFAVWPSLGFLVCAGSSRARQIAGTIAGFVLALTVLLAMVLTDTHTPAEAIAGMLVGLAVPVLLARNERLASLRGSMQLAIVATVALLCAFAPRIDYDIETAIARTAGSLHAWWDATSCAAHAAAHPCEHAGATGIGR